MTEGCIYAPYLLLGEPGLVFAPPAHQAGRIQGDVPE